MPNNKEYLKSILKHIFDELNKFLILVLFILIIVTLFIRNFFLDLSKIVILILVIFRLTSKDKVKRSKENNTYLKIKKTILKPFNIFKTKASDKNNVYKKCPKCHTVLKLPLPKKRGVNHAKCPNCQNRVTIINLRKAKKEKIKVEVIKKKK